MGWNDHDDRLMYMAETLEGFGMPYGEAYEVALDLRMEELRGADLISEDALYQIAVEDQP